MSGVTLDLARAQSLNRVKNFISCVTVVSVSLQAKREKRDARGNLPRASFALVSLGLKETETTATEAKNIVF